MLQVYTPLYRKYRPQKFSDLVGQDAISQTLVNAILNNRVAHAYLFTGPRGTGKTSSARILAKSLNCEKGPTPDPCGVCASCVDITSGNALDVIEIDAASNRSVEDARDLIDRVHFAPVSGRYKVYVIDEVHMLTKDAFNTLLKTLEEPPPSLVFILATTEIHKVLETIISRCQRFDFRRISQDALVNRLKYIADLEKINISQESLSLIARRSAGGMRDALGLLDQISVISSDDTEINLNDVLNLIGALPEDVLIKLSEGIAARDGSFVLSQINELMAFGSEPVQLVKELTINFRNLLIASAVEGDLKGIIDASEEFYDDIRRVSKKFDHVEIAHIIDRLVYTERMVRSSSQPTLWLEVGILSICYRHEVSALEELKKRIDQLEKMISSGNIPVATQVRPSVDYEKPSIPKKRPPVSSLPPKAVAVHPEPESVLKEIRAEIEEKNAGKIEKPVQEIKKTVAPIKQEEPDLREEIQEEPIDEPSLESPVSAGSASSFPLDETWNRIVNSISSLPTKGMFASLAVPLAITEHEVVVAFSQSMFVDQVNQPNRLNPFKNALMAVLGFEPKITFTVIATNDYNTAKANKEKKTLNEEPSFSEVKTAPVEVSRQVKAEEVNGEECIPLEEGREDFQETKVLEDVSEQNLPEQVGLVKEIFQGKILKI